MRHRESKSRIRSRARSEPDIGKSTDGALHGVDYNDPAAARFQGLQRLPLSGIGRIGITADEHSGPCVIDILAILHRRAGQFFAERLAAAAAAGGAARLRSARPPSLPR